MSTEIAQAVVIGAGVSGLAAAYALKHAGLKPTVIDPSAIGGLVRTKKVDDFVLEQGPNVFLDKPAIKRLIAQLNLSDQVVYPKVSDYKQYVWHADGPAIIPKNPISLLKSGLIDTSSKLSLLPRLFCSNRIDRDLDDISIGNFFASIIGDKAVESMLDPGLRGIYGGNVWRLSLRSLFPQVWEHFRSDGSIIRYLKKKKASGKKRIFVLREGNARLVERLYECLKEDLLFVKDEVISIEKTKSSDYLICTSTSRIRTKCVVISTAGPASARFISPLDSTIAERLKLVRYASLIVAHCAVPRDERVLDQTFGILFPSKSQTKLMGIMFNSVLFPHTAPQGKHLLTVCLGGVDQDRVMAMTDKVVEEEIKQELVQKFGIDQVHFLSQCRWSNAIPQYELGHFELINEIKRVERENPGLYFIGADCRGIGVPDRVQAGIEVGQKIASEFEQDLSTNRAVNQ